MSVSTLLIVVVVILLLSVSPVWPYSRSWGAGPVGGLGLLLIVLLVLLLLGKI